MNSSDPGSASASTDNPHTPYPRTTLSILWSCVTTIILCTWVSLHPNLPKPTKEHAFLERLARKAEMMFVAMLVPELTTVWAWRQWLAARRMTRKYSSQPFSVMKRIRAWVRRWWIQKMKRMYKNLPELAHELLADEEMTQEVDAQGVTKENEGSQWTLTHSFFALMGGFVLVHQSDDGEVTVLKTIQPKDLAPWIEKKQIPISEYQLCDRSKGDGLTKTLAVLQTAWFILQFFTRIYQRLGITELELVTMSYAVLNIGTYGFWWNKPLGIVCPVQLTACDRADSDRIHKWAELEIGLVPEMRFKGMALHKLLSLYLKIFYNKDVLWYDKVVWALLFPLLAAVAVTTDIVMGSISLLSCAARDILHDHNTTRDMLNRHNVVHLRAMINDYNATMGIFHDYPDLSDENLYWRYFHGDKSDTYAGSLTWVLATLFGAVHCAAWSFAFPSLTEKILWRVCASIAALFPPVLALLEVLNFFVKKLERGIHWKVLGLQLVPGFLGFMAVILYTGARCILVVQMFLLLRSQSESVFTAIDWLSYIPHF